MSIKYRQVSSLIISVLVDFHLEVNICSKGAIENERGVQNTVNSTKKLIFHN